MADSSQTCQSTKYNCNLKHIIAQGLPEQREPEKASPMRSIHSPKFLTTPEPIHILKRVLLRTTELNTDVNNSRDRWVQETELAT